MRLISSYHLPKLEDEVLQIKNSPRRPLWPVIKAVHLQIFEQTLSPEFKKASDKVQKLSSSLKSEQEAYKALNTVYFTFLSLQQKEAFLLQNSAHKTLLFSAFYQYLGHLLGLSLTFISIENFSLLKFNPKKSGPVYIDLKKHGLPTKYSEMISHLKTHTSLTPPHSLSLLTFYLSQQKEEQTNPNIKILCLSLLLKLNPLNLKHYTERTLLMRDTGNDRLAYYEAKKILSLFGRKNTPKEIQLLFYDIKNKDLFEGPVQDHLH